MQKISIQSNNLKLVGNLFLPSKVNTANGIGVLILHGGSVTGKDRFISLQNYLAQNKLVSLAVDFRGIGESEGTFKLSSLLDRLADAQATLKAFSSYANKVIVIGCSMGAHVAVKLLEGNNEVRETILLYPAAYGKKAERLPFDQSFTNELRTPNSWKDSPVFPVLRKYLGKIMIIYGQEDTIIPSEVKAAYQKAIENKGRFTMLPNVNHLLLAEKSPQERKIRDKVFSMILEFVDEPEN